jgi:hypothetical protein
MSRILNKVETSTVNGLISDAFIQSGVELHETLEQIWNLSLHIPFKYAFGNPQTGFLSRLVNVIRYETAENCSSALGCIWFLSRCHELRPYIASKELGLLPVILPFCEPNHRFYQYVVKILSNCSIHAGAHQHLLLSPRSNYLEKLRALSCSLASIPNAPFVSQSCHCIGVACNNPAVIVKLIENNLVQLVFQFLYRHGPNPRQWHSDEASEYFGICFLANLSSHVEFRRHIYDNYEEYQYLYRFLLELMRFDGIEGFVGSLVFINVYSKRVFDPSLPPIVPFIVDSVGFEKETVYHIASSLCFRKRLEAFFEILTLSLELPLNASQKSNYNYAFGVIRLKCLFSTLCNLLSYQSTRLLLLTCFGQDVFSVIYKGLELFVDNADEPSYEYEIAIEYSGGGGSDYDTAKLILECLTVLLSDGYYGPTDSIESLREHECVLRNIRSKISTVFRQISNITPKFILTVSQVMSLISLERWLELQDLLQMNDVRRDRARKVPEEIFRLSELVTGQLIFSLSTL